MYKNTHELYKAIYNVLNKCKQNPDYFCQYMESASKTEINQVVEVVKKYNLIEGIRFHKNANNCYISESMSVIYLTSDGLRFIKLYATYKDNNIDILSMLSDNSLMIEYLIEKDIREAKYRFIKTISIIVFSALISALITVMVNNAFSKENHSSPLQNQQRIELLQLLDPIHLKPHQTKL